MTQSTPTQVIKSGMIVRFEGGHYRVTKATKNTVNLGAVFGGRVYHKGVDITLVQEDEAAWYSNWSRSESYQCM
jgi:hypothetical protein